MCCPAPYTTTTGYTPKGELVSYTYPDGTAVGRSYTARGELYQLTHAGTTIDTRVYDNGGRMTSSTYNNGVSETRAYNTDNTLASINFAGASIGNLTYGWDANKNKTSEAIAGTMSNYGFTVPANGYDSEDRLVGFNRTSGLTQSWSLSAVGDWNSVTTNSSTETRTHGPTHELLTAGGQNVSTDTKGNITLIPGALRPNASSLLLNWDFDNQLNTADVGNNASVDVTYKFDALGRRVFRDDGTTAAVYVQAGQQTIADYTASSAASSPTYRYVYASYIDEPVLRFKPSGSESLYYHRNQQYSVVALTNASAAIIERYAYTAYGMPTITNASGTLLPVGSVDNRYLYTGREWDQTLAMYHYRARMYDSQLGRFASRDPIGFKGGVNYFEYVRSSPMNYVDFLGLAYLRCQMTAARRIPGLFTDPETGVSTPIRRLYCQIQCYCPGDTLGNDESVDLPFNDSWDINEMRDVCNGAMASIWDNGDCDCRRRRAPVRSPTPVRSPVKTPVMPPVLPVSPVGPSVAPTVPGPTRPWWPRILSPLFPSFPAFMMPMLNLPEPLKLGDPMIA